MGFNAMGLVGGFGQALGEGLNKGAVLLNEEKDRQHQLALQQQHQQYQQQMARDAEEARARGLRDSTGMQLLMHLAGQEAAPGLENVAYDIASRFVSGKIPSFDAAMQEYVDRTTRTAPLPQSMRQADANIDVAAPIAQQAAETIAPAVQPAQALAASGLLPSPMMSAIQGMQQMASEVPQDLRAEQSRIRSQQQQVSGPETREEQAAREYNDYVMRLQAGNQAALEGLRSKMNFDPDWVAWSGLKQAFDSTGTYDPKVTGALASSAMYWLQNSPQMALKLSASQDPVALVKEFQDSWNKAKVITDPANGGETGRIMPGGIFIPAADQMWGLIAVQSGFKDQNGQPIGPDFFMIHDLKPGVTDIGGKSATERQQTATRLSTLGLLDEAAGLLEKHPNLQPPSFAGYRSAWQKLVSMVKVGKASELTPSELDDFHKQIADGGKYDLLLQNEMERADEAPDPALTRAYLDIMQRVREGLARAQTGAQAGYSELRALYKMMLDLYSPDVRGRISTLRSDIIKQLDMKGIIYLDEQQRMAKEALREQYKTFINQKFGLSSGMTYADMGPVLGEYLYGVNPMDAATGRFSGVFGTNSPFAPPGLSDILAPGWRPPQPQDNSAGGSYPNISKPVIPTVDQLRDPRNWTR